MIWLDKFIIFDYYSTLSKLYSYIDKKDKEAIKLEFHLYQNLLKYLNLISSIFKILIQWSPIRVKMYLVQSEEITNFFSL